MRAAATLLVVVTAIVVSTTVGGCRRYGGSPRSGEDLGTNMGGYEGTGGSRQGIKGDPPPELRPQPPRTGSEGPFPTVESGDAKYAMVGVFYGTDRRHTGRLDVNEKFSGERGYDLAVGYATVSIPLRHRCGAIERPWAWGDETPGDHVVLMSANNLPQESFYRLLRTRVERSAGKEAFVFIHGYNTEFREAAYRTAQIAYDMGFDGAPVMYSWPSLGTEKGYVTDRNNAENAGPFLRRFLQGVKDQSGARRLHVIAHSMGNLAFAVAARELAAASATQPDGTPKMFSEIVLAAADLDTNVFKTQYAQCVRQLGQRVTVYASKLDRPLNVAKAVWGSYPRLGQAGENIFCLAGFDTVDASLVDTTLLNHTYFADNTSIISDLVLLLRVGRQPKDRCLVPQGPADPRPWLFDPASRAHCQQVYESLLTRR